MGSTNCCTDKDSGDYYGYCKHNTQSNEGEGDYCPDGSDYVCKGGNCPAAVTCEYQSKSHKSDMPRWGSVKCTGGSDGKTCPQGFAEGMFCLEDHSCTDSAPKICCNSLPLSLAPTPTPTAAPTAVVTAAPSVEATATPTAKPTSARDQPVCVTGSFQMKCKGDGSQDKEVHEALSRTVSKSCQMEKKKVVTGPDCDRVCPADKNNNHNGGEDNNYGSGSSSYGSGSSSGDSSSYGSGSSSGSNGKGGKGGNRLLADSTYVTSTVSFTMVATAEGTSSLLLLSHLLPTLLLT
jgi:hypothetical protein